MERTPRRRQAAKAWLASVTIVGVTTLGATASAQAPPGDVPPASGSVVSVLGSTIQLATAGRDETVTVIIDAATTYQKLEATSAKSIAVGDCVRINGTGSAKKGVKASSGSVTDANDGECYAGTVGRGAGDQGFLQPDNTGGGATSAAGRVVSTSNGTVVVVGMVITIPTKLSSPPNVSSNTKVRVTLAADATIAQTVAGTAFDVAVGTCATATGTGDSNVIAAETVVVSAPEADGTCAAVSSAGGRLGYDLWPHLPGSQDVCRAREPLPL